MRSQPREEGIIGPPFVQQKVQLGVLALGLLGVVIMAASCAKVASVVLDLPQHPQPDAGTPAPQAGTRGQGPAGGGFAAAARDTVRPPIEAMLAPDSVLAMLPRDSAGEVDWMAALRLAVIRPRRAAPGAPSPPDMDGFRFDFRFKGPDPMFDAVFPHSTHVQWAACDMCHGRIFPYRNPEITMAAIENREYCGACHGRVAFPTSSCGRCHPAMPLSGDQKPELADDVVMVRAADSSGQSPAVGAFPAARFPHWMHRIRYRCSACHPSLFEAKTGADTLTMADIRQGRACGACHDGRSAFSAMECSRCHAAPRTARDSVP